MFTGLVEGTATVHALIPEKAGVRLVLDFQLETPSGSSPVTLGESISISGCCLTVVSIESLPGQPEPMALATGESTEPMALASGEAKVNTAKTPEASACGSGLRSYRLGFQAGEETLSKTKLGKLVAGSLVNFERSLRVGDRMGGHFVTGHVDGLGKLVRRDNDGEWSYFYFSAPLPLLRQMVNKGSITIDGVSLTVVLANDEQFNIALIPHTLSVTTLGQLHVGDIVNLETDILAKYVQRIQN